MDGQQTMARRPNEKRPQNNMPPMGIKTTTHQHLLNITVDSDWSGYGHGRFHRTECPLLIKVD